MGFYAFKELHVFFFDGWVLFMVISFHFQNGSILKWYYDQKITLIFSPDFETMFVKHSPSEIISLNFEKKTVNLNCTFPF